jgi:hypothetical protein
MNSKIKTAIKGAESNKDSDKKRHTTHKSKITSALQEKMGKQSNAWPLH